MRKILAFTLAETLIVMGIIGIVSALTLPNLNSSTGEKEKIAKVKKLYRDLEDAYGRSVAVYGPADEWFTSSDNSKTLQATRFGDRFTEFLKVSKNCGTTTNCINGPSLKNENGSVWAEVYSSSNYYKVILADGTSLFMRVQDANFAYVSGEGILYGIDAIIDIDGTNKGKNTYGVDLFAYSVTKDGFSPDGITSKDTVVKSCFETGYYCNGWIINYDNMDYLKADSTGKCNGSNITLNPAANPPVISCK